jgi:hypothetical protein
MAKWGMRRGATLETGMTTTAFNRRCATEMMFRAAGPWLESHGYHHMSVSRGANGIAER